MLQLRQIILATNLFLFTNACATKVDGLQVSDAFTVENIRSHSIVSAGVVDSKQVLLRADSNAYAGVLLSKIKDERPYANVRAVETLINALGEDRYAEVLNKYSASGLDAPSLDEIASKLPGVQFIALAKIESDITQKNSKETQASESKDDKGNVTKVEASIEQTHSRTVIASLNIYDLKNKNSAFSGQVSKTLEERRKYNPDGLRGVISLVNAIRGEEQDKTYPYPEAPATRKVLGEVFEGFAENFPKD